MFKKLTTFAIVFFWGAILGVALTKIDIEKTEKVIDAISCSTNAECPADKPNCSDGECKGGSCRGPEDCAWWETCQDGGCRSSSGCTRDSDCADNKKCNNNVCEGGTPPTCDQCNYPSDAPESRPICRNSMTMFCGNDYCWHGVSGGTACAGITPVARPTNSSSSGSPQCTNSPDSGCSTGGQGGVDCAACRQTEGVVKQCTDGVWYCCYRNGECFKGNVGGGVVCSGTTITNNTNQTLSVDIYSGCETNNKIGTSPLVPGQSTSAGDCKQIDIVNYCGVCNPNNCKTNTPTPPHSTSTPTPTSTPTNTPTPTNTLTPSPSPTGTLTPTPSPTSTPTPTPTPTGTLTPTPTPTNTPTPTPTPTPTWRKITRSCSEECGFWRRCEGGFTCIKANNGSSYCSRPENENRCRSVPTWDQCCQNVVWPTATPTITLNKIRIDKKISSDNKNFIDNIDFNQKIFRKGETVYFKIEIVNLGPERISNLEVTDTLPNDLGLLYNPGSYNSNTRVISWQIRDLEVGKSQVFDLAARVLWEDRIVKRINWVNARGERINLSDSAYYYVGKEKMPVTGPEGFLWQSMTVATIGGAMIVLRKLTRGY